MAADEPSETTDMIPQFIRVYAPIKKIEQWPTRLLPMDRTEFEHHLENLKPEAFKTSESRPRISSAVYSATLNGDSLTGGRAVLKIDHPKGGPALLKLSPWGMATDSARWQRADEIGKNPAPDAPINDLKRKTRGATLGTDASGHLAALVDGSGRLDVSWSLRRESGPSERLRFVLDLPQCPANVLMLDLPANRVPYVRDAVISEISTVAEKPEPSSNARRQWRLAIGGRHRVTLTLGYRPDARRSRRLTLARQSSRYRLMPRGTNITTSIRLNVHHEPLRRLKLAVDPGLRVVSVRHGTIDVPWDVATDESHVMLTFSEPIQGADRVIKIHAIAPIETGRSWVLPRIYPTGLFWQEGLATLNVGEPLSLDSLDVIDGQQATPLAAGVVTLRYFDPQATVNLRIGFRQNRPRLSSATTIQIGNETTTGQLVGDLRIKRAHRSRIEAATGRGWIIDTVTSSPEGSVISWYVESEKRRARLKIQLEPIRPGEPRRLVIKGRRRGLSPGEMIDADQLKMLQFDEVDIERELVSVAAGPRYRLRLEGDEQLSRIDPQSVNESDALLLDDHHADLLFLEDQHTARLAVGLERARPQFHGELSLDLTAGERQLDQSYTIRAVPNNEPLDHVVVHFSHARDEPLRWSMPSDGEDAFVVRRANQRERIRAGLDASGQTWVVELKQPRRNPFTIRAVRTSPFTSQQPASLTTLPEATSQTGQVQIRIVDGGSLSIDNRRLSPWMSPPERLDEYASVRAAYRYDPLADATSDVHAALSLSPATTDAATPLAWAYDCRLQTHLASDGTIRHVAMYGIENAGRQTITVTMPDGVRLDEARIDGVATDFRMLANRPEESGGEAPLLLEMPVGTRFPTVSLHYAPALREQGLKAAQLGSFSTIASLEPKLDIPVLSRSWTCWVPPGYQLLDRRATTPPRMTWSQRLFGPLGRGAEGQPFNLFAPAQYVGQSVQSKAIVALGIQTETLLDHLGRVAHERLASRDNAPLTWGSLLAEAVPHLLVDRQALGEIGISPHSPVRRLVTIDKHESSSAGMLSLIQRSGMALLVHPHAVVLTSATQATVGGQQTVALHGFASGDRTASVPLRLLPGKLADRLERAASFGGDWGYLSASAWNAIGDDDQIPWSLREGVAATQVGWSVYRIDLENDTPTEARVVRIAVLQMSAWCLGLIVAALIWSKLGNRATTILTIATTASTAALLMPAAYAVVVPIFSGILLGLVAALLLRALTRRSVVATDSVDETTITDKFSLAQTLGIFLLVTTVAATIHGQEADPGSSNGTASNGNPNNDTENKKTEKNTSTDPGSMKHLPGSGPRPYRVFLPIDSDKQPVGDKVYVPEGLYEQLLRRSAQHQNEPRGTLIESVVYRTTLDWNAERTSLGVVDMSAEFKVEVFDAASTIRLSVSEPSAKGAGNLLKLTSVHLNGRSLHATTYRWQKDGKTLLIPADQPGRHRVTLSWKPRLTHDDQTAGLDIDVAPIAGARVEVTMPADAPTVSVPNGLGQHITGEPTGRLATHLGPTTRLSLRWPQEATPHGQRRIEIDQLLLLNVQPGAVRLTDRIKYRVIDGSARQIVLQVDPRLRLLPFDQDSPVESSRRLPNDPSSIVLKLANPAQKHGVIDVHFLMEGTHGVGKLRLPHIGQQSSQLGRRWLAVVVDAALKIDVPEVDGVEPIAGAEFGDLWGSPFEQPPRFAYRLSPEEVDWSMSSRPALPQTDVNQTLTMRFGHRNVQYDYQAKLTITSGYALRYRVTVPRNAEIDQVSLVNSDGEEQVVHWRHHDSDSLTLFLREPITGENRLSIQADRKLNPSGQMPLATFQIDGAQTGQRRYRLFRSESTLLSVKHVKGLTTAATAKEGDLLPDTENLSPRDDDRLVADLMANRPRIAATLVYRPNEPQVDATAVTTMHREDDGTWTVRFDYQVNVSGGLIDQLRFDLPPEWSGPPTLDSSDAWRLEQVPGQPWRRFIIRFNTPIQGPYRLSFHGRVTRATELRVPLVKPLGKLSLRRFLVLPTQIADRPIVWNRRRVTQKSLPQGFKPSSRSTGSVATYLIGDDAEVTLDSDAASSGIPRVRLADLHMRWNDDGGCHGIGIFDLQPAGRSFCLVEMPPTLQIVHASVDGIAAFLEPVGQRTWRVPLASRLHAQQIQVLFSGTISRSDQSGDRVDLVAPSFQELPVEQTMWTLHGPQRGDQGSRSPTTNDIKPLAQQLIRIKTIGELLAAEESAPTETDANWKQNWTRRLRQATNRFESLARHDRLADDNEMMQEMRLVEKRLFEQGLVTARPLYVVGRPNAHAQRLQTSQHLSMIAAPFAARLLMFSSNQWAFEVPTDQAAPLRDALQEAALTSDTLWQITSTPPMATTTDRLWYLSQSFQQPASHLMFKGPRSNIQVDAPAQHWSAMPSHALLATLLVALSIVTGIGLRHRSIVEAIVVRPHLLGVVAGLFWWLFLWPSGFGWVIIAVSLFASFRVTCPSTTVSLPSTITRLRLPDE